VTSKVKDYAEAESLAQQIKSEICEREKLTCSIGIGTNKLVAKIASDHKKPNGLTIVREQEAEAFLSLLPVRKLLWVGRKTERRLSIMGIKTVGDLARFDPAILTENFGVAGAQFHLMSHAVDISEVEERSQTKSVSRDVTFEEDTSNFEFVLNVLDELATEVNEDVLDRGYFFRTITIRVRYEDFETYTQGRTLPVITNRLQDLRKSARELMQGHFRADRKIRLIGLRASNLASLKEQKTLF
jgi:DNA polymerase IV (DinB-like DNA polymerase)